MTFRSQDDATTQMNVNRIINLYQSTIGKKVIAAVTGLILFGFLAGHVAGNLKVFSGNNSDNVPHIDIYGHHLRVMGEPMVPQEGVLWLARAVLLGSVLLHITVVVQLSMQSNEARPVGYVKTQRKMASFSALYMMFSGLLIAFFIVFHILHLTSGVIVFKEFSHGRVYENLYNSFSADYWYVGAFYIFTMVVIGFHLNHGVWSLFQTLGIDNPDRNRMLRIGSTVLTILIVAGFIAVPLGFLGGGMQAPPDYPMDALGH